MCKCNDYHQTILYTDSRGRNYYSAPITCKECDPSLAEKLETRNSELLVELAYLDECIEDALQEDDESQAETYALQRIELLKKIEGARNA